VRFLVVEQAQRGLSRGYEVASTPFSILIDEQQLVGWSAVVNNEKGIRYALKEAPARGRASR
jgi:hypothetical protein